MLALRTPVPSFVLFLAMSPIGSAAPQTPAPTTPLPLDNQIAVHGASRGRAFTSTRDGEWLFHSEGATLVFLHTKAGGTYDDANMTPPDGVKRVPIGAKGVAVSRMMLDPDSDLHPGPNSSDPGTPATNLLYLAAGRDGLWVMEADVTAANESNRAWRVDDSGNATDPTTQQSRRWCTDVATMVVGGEQYLVATFARKSFSVLRAYRLADVRAIAHPANGNPETGAEISPAVQVALTNHPNAPSAGPHPSFSRSVALSMAVDSTDDTPLEEEADVYVAMGPHGIVRVHFDPDVFGVGTDPTVTWGPVFGTDSAYEQGTVPPPPGKTVPAALYGDLVWESNFVFLDTQEIERAEAPMFLDVATYQGLDVDENPVHHLYAAVDHLLWVCFDLDQPFGPQMQILHHEGEPDMFTQPNNGAVTMHYMRAVDDELMPALNKNATCARALDVVEHPSLGPILVVTGPNPFVRDFLAYQAESIGYDYRLRPGGVSGDFPSRTRTLFYEVRSSWPDPDLNFVRWMEFGGQELALPSEQPEPGYFMVFHNFRVEPFVEDDDHAGGVCMALVPLPTGTRDVNPRANSDMPGRLGFRVGASIVDPDLLLVGGNDGGVAEDGFHATGTGPSGYEIKRHYSPPPGSATDDRGPGGLLLDGEAQWQEDPVEFSEEQHVWCSGTLPSPLEGSANRWELLHLRIPGLDGYANEPVRVAYWFFTPPLDSFGAKGRRYYMAAYLSRDFDAFLAGLGHTERRMFGTWARSPEALVVMDRQSVLDEADEWAGDGDLILVQNSSIIVRRLLVVHPEFNNMPRLHPILQNFWGSPSTHGDDINGMPSWPPKIIEVQPGRWVLAAPCGAILADPDWDIYDASRGGDPAWLPDPESIWETYFTHGLVQFWELAPDPNDQNRYWPVVTTDNGVENVSPLQKIVTPDPNGNVWKIEPLKMTIDGDPRTYLFVVDMVGRLYVYSIKDIVDLGGTHTALDNGTYLTERWETPENLFDDQATLIWDVAIDHRGTETAMVYVAVPRVGVKKLEFDPEAPAGSRLKDMGVIQTADYTSGVYVRVGEGGTRHLVVYDHGGGIRVYGE